MQHQLSDEFYRRFRDLIARRAGLHYPEAKREDLAHGLSLAIQATGAQSLGTLYAAAHDDGAAWEAIVASLTVGETYFFRHATQFEALRQRIFPELIAQRAGLRMLRIWSAGCATGEEPYSIAMLLHELLPELASWHVTILATDINSRFLERAREGLYGAWSFREESTAWRERYFTPEQGRWRLRPEIRRMVTFAPLNLAEPSYPSFTTGTGALDLIVCRNVTIYFDQPTTRQIVGRFHRALLPGGWLMVGHAEPDTTTYRQFQVHNFPDAIVYRKALEAPGVSAPPSEAADEPGAAPRRRALSAAPRAGQQQGGRGLAMAPRSAEALGGRSPHKAAPATPSPGDDQASWAAIRLALQAGDAHAIERHSGILTRNTAALEAALLRLAGIAADAGAWSYAEEYCSRALTHNLLSTQAHLLVARVYERQGRLDAALEAYRRARYLDPNSVAAMLGMAGIWTQLGRPPEAANIWRAAIRRLAALPPYMTLPDTDGATASELLALAEAQLQQLGASSASVAARAPDGKRGAP